MKSVGNDVSNHASIAGDKIGAGRHKAGVALGVSERTPGEKVDMLESKGDCIELSRQFALRLHRDLQVVQIDCRLKKKKIFYL